MVAVGSAAQLPTGTVTFVMTDIEGSKRLLQTLGDQSSQLLADHYHLLREAFGSAGVEVRSEGDAVFYVFVDAPSAVRAALDGQHRLAEHPWPVNAPVRVRMGIHSGEGRLLDGDYVGLDVHRRARITDAGQSIRKRFSDSFPFACLAWQLGFTAITPARGGAMPRRSTRHIAGVSCSGPTWRSC